VWLLPASSRLFCSSRHSHPTQHNIPTHFHTAAVFVLNSCTLSVLYA
jgi:hypothetical protein